MSEDKLFSPFKLKDFTLKNRIGVAPMTRTSSVKDSVPRQDVFDFLVRRAKKGAAIVYTEAIVTDYESAQGYPNQSRMLTQRQIDAWKPVVEAIHNENSIAIMQMFHCGRMSWPEINPAGRVIAPSPITPKQNNPLTGKPYTIPDEMTHFDIDHVINGFIETAKGGLMAGFDGIEIHFAHGYLPSQFLSSYSNRRKDQYGGSVENRFRFAHELIQAVNDIMPDEQLLSVRISDWGRADMDISLFGTKMEYQKIITYLSQEPIDVISVSTHNYSLDAYGSGKTFAQITREVTELPIMICGKIYDRKTADDAVEDADIVLSGRSLLLNPNWVEDIKSEKKLQRYEADEANVAFTDKPLL